MTDTAPSAPPRALFVYAIFYGGMTVLAGVLGNKQVALGDWPLVGPLAVEAGIFAFLLLVILSSTIAELYGRAMANRLVLLGFLPLIASMLLGWFVLALPASPEMAEERQAAFALMMGATWRIWMGGIVAYGVSQLLNVSLFSSLRRGTGRLVWLRGGIAGALSQVVDTLIFISIAFYGVFPIGQLLIGQMAAKVLLSILIVPLLIQGLVRLGRSLDGSADAHRGLPEGGETA